MFNLFAVMCGAIVRAGWSVMLFFFSTSYTSVGVIAVFMVSFKKANNGH
ncbi:MULTISPECIES: hypothetical protein [Bacillaceae]|nr:MULTISPECIES: hypothetical protein [Bacillaceae]MCE4047975.1 hypothetical protein [Bacillus sp. Au-Bac7]UPO89190.1 hypothetical protein L8T27_008610 [Niallia sp. Man26]